MIALAMSLQRFLRHIWLITMLRALSIAKSCGRLVRVWACSRWRRKAASVVFCTLASISDAKTYALSTPPAGLERLESSILASRRAITSGEFMIEVSSNGQRGPSTVSYHTWIAPGGLARQEKSIQSELQVSIFNETSAFYYNGRPGEQSNPDRSKRHAVQMLPASEARPDRPPYLICDPRTLMFVPVQFSLLAHSGLESRVNGVDRNDLVMRRSSWNGVDSIIVDFSIIKPPNSYEYEVVPSRGYNIVRWRMRGMLSVRGSPVPFEDILSCELAQLSKSIWFPTTVHMTSVRGGELYLEQTVKILPRFINVALDHDMFTLKGAGIPANQVVLQGLTGRLADMNRGMVPTSRAITQRSGKPIGKPLLFWDGTSLRPMTQSDEVAIELSKVQAVNPHARQRLWGALILTVCGCVAIAASIWRSRRSRQRKTSRS